MSARRWLALPGPLLALPALAACNGKRGCCHDLVCPLPMPLTVVVAPQAASLGLADTTRFIALVAGVADDPCKDEAKPTSRAVTWSVGDGTVAGIVATPDSNAVVVRGLAAGKPPIIASAVADTTVNAAGPLTVEAGAPKARSLAREAP